MFTASIWSLKNLPRATVVTMFSLMCYKKQLLWDCRNMAKKSTWHYGIDQIWVSSAVRIACIQGDPEALYLNISPGYCQDFRKAFCLSLFFHLPLLLSCLRPFCLSSLCVCPHSPKHEGFRLWLLPGFVQPWWTSDIWLNKYICKVFFFVRFFCAPGISRTFYTPLALNLIAISPFYLKGKNLFVGNNEGLALGQWGTMIQSWICLTLGLHIFTMPLPPK